VPDHAETAYAIATDKEASGTVVELETLLPSRPQKTVADYRQQTVDNLFSGMLFSPLCRNHPTTERAVPKRGRRQE
jgi:hypothetical protein